jgi:hypothetical protein
LRQGYFQGPEAICQLLDGARANDRSRDDGVVQ